MKKVLVYKENVLGRSETFIKEQLLSLTAWHPVLVGIKQNANGLPLDGLDVRLLGELTRSGWQRFRWNLSRHMDLPPQVLVRALAAEHAHLIHVHFGTEAVRFWPVLKALNLPVLVTLHGFDINTAKDWWESGRGGHWMKRYPRRLLRLAADERVRFIAVSNAIRDSAIAFGIPAEKIIVRYIGIDTNQFRPGPVPIDKRAPRVLFVGRLVEKKGVRHLIQAFVEARRTVPDAELVIAGDGPLRSELSRLAASLNCPVTFLGAITPAQVREQMDAARVFCLPSITAPNGDAEGFGMVILEAQACGVPVISSAKGGAQEGIVNGKTGFAHAEGDTAGLAAALVRLLTDDALARDFSAAGRVHVIDHFDIAACSAALEATFDEVLRTVRVGG